jgi:glycosyltransferase involved in cell wall biosynthesis
MRRVGFTVADRADGWIGGLNYRRNLVSAILANPDRRIEPVLIVPPDLPERQLAGFPAMEIVRSPLAEMGARWRRLGQVSRRLIERDLVLERLMARHRLDLLSHSAALGARSALPCINWIPDFQHLRLPHFFPQDECDRRDASFRRLIDGSRIIVVSSADAAKDLAGFAPQAGGKVRVLHFVSGFENAGEELPADEIERRFAIGRRYFHLPNQFWAHKNHALVIEALGLLKERQVDVLVVATGKTEDARDPGHFARLMARARELGVEDRFRVLGVVSLAELRGLMVNAVALINPSNFEGWSTTVEESKSLGLPIVLSDIPVHLEQAPPLGRYFEAGSAQSLADAMMAALSEHDEAAAARAREAAAAAMPERLRRFGRAYEEIALEAITG